jgi:membrane protease YdiL (CAAX protease family)
MDNRWYSQLKRGLKVTTDYLIMLIVFVVFALLALNFAKEGSAGFVPLFSFLVFLLSFYTIYVDMRNIAFKEKRPQYNINPSPFKGLFYGLIGVIPLIILQIIVMNLGFPESLQTFQRRIYQGIGGPLYWFTRLIGNQPLHYLLSFILIVIIAGLGYFAGHYEFYMAAYVRKLLGIKPKKRPPKR